MSLYIATLDEVKADLGIGDTEDDAVLTRWLEGLQGRLDGFCNRRFLYSAAETEIVDGGVTAVLVRRFPIASVTEIIIDADQNWSADDALDSDDYRLNYRRGAIVYGIGRKKWPAGTQNIRVRYAGGFIKSDGTAADHVDDYELQLLKRAFLMQGEFEWRNRDTLGITQISHSGASKQVGAGTQLAIKGITLLPEVEQTLVPLKRFV